MKKTILSTTLVIILTAGVSAKTHASLASNATLNIGPQTGFCAYDAGTYPDACVVAAYPDGNYFAMDNDGSGAFEDGERIGITAGTDGGIVLGAVQGVGDIDAAWDYFGSTGFHTQAGTLSIASDDGAGNVRLDMTGWTVNWNDGDIDMGHGLPAMIKCSADCSDGDTFILEYFAIVPGGSSIVPYKLHLSGTISAVPVPATVWLFGSGFFGLIGMARRKKA